MRAKHHSEAWALTFLNLQEKDSFLIGQVAILPESQGKKSDFIVAKYFLPIPMIKDKKNIFSSIYELKDYTQTFRSCVLVSVNEVKDSTLFMCTVLSGHQLMSSQIKNIFILFFFAYPRHPFGHKIFYTVRLCLQYIKLVYNFI